MKKTFTLRNGLLMAFFLTLSVHGFAQVAGDYRTYNGTAGTTSANTNTKTHWEVYNGTAWEPANYVPAAGSLTILQLCTFNTASNVATFSGSDTSLNAIRANQFVSPTAPDTNIPAGTKVSSISGTTITLSKNPTAVSTVATRFLEQTSITCSGNLGTAILTFPTAGTADALAVGMCVTNANIPVGTTILSVDSDTQVTLSANIITANVTSATFFTKETTGATTLGSKTITLASANSLVVPGMNVYNSTSISYGTRVVSVSGNTIELSVPSTSTVAAVGVVFGYHIIPNLYINGNCMNNANAQSATIGNVYVNNAANAYPTGSSGAIMSTTVNPIFTVGNNNNATTFVCKTLSIASGSTARTNQTTSVYTHNLILNGGEGGNAINNSGIIDFVASNGHKTNISFAHVGNTTITGGGAFNAFNILVPGSTVTVPTNISTNGGTLAQGSSIILTNGAVITGTPPTLNTNDFDKLGSEIKLWPNPAHDQFNITNAQNQLDGASTIEISNLNGQVVHSQKSNPGTTSTIQTNGWAKGVYMVKTSNNGSQTTKKLIIQ